jgi:hypothetical protein
MNKAGSRPHQPTRHAGRGRGDSGDAGARRGLPHRPAAGKPVQLIEAPNYAHLEMCESLGNPYGPNGRAALAMMKLVPA